jgi:hypothetical protein
MQEAEEAEAKSKAEKAAADAAAAAAKATASQSQGQMGLPPGLAPPPGLGMPKHAVAAPAPSSPLPAASSSSPSTVGVSVSGGGGVAMAMGSDDGLIDLDSADDDVLLSYALSLSRMDEAPGKDGDKHSDEKSAADQQEAVATPAPMNDLVKLENQLAENFEASATASVAPSEPSQGSGAATAPPRTPSPSLKKEPSPSSQARLLSMIDAALDSPVGEYKYTPSRRSSGADSGDGVTGGVAVGTEDVEFDLFLQEEEDEEEGGCSGS